MKFSMTGQEKGDCSTEVTTWTGLTVFEREKKQICFEIPGQKL